MNKKTLLLGLFIVVVIAQLYVPAKMIWDKEEIIETGRLYKFQTEPIDPTDPFRGKYIVLRFSENKFKVTDSTAWQTGERIYLSLKTGAKGYANIQSISKSPPSNKNDYLEAKVGYVDVFNGGQPTLTIEYPFDRYYMEESKAYEAELAFRDSRQINSTETYAVVIVKTGHSVLEDVMIGGRSIREVVKANRENEVSN